MIKQTLYITAIVSVFCFAACNSSINADELYGKWNYTKVEHPNANPPDSLSKEELQRESPSIEFSKNNNYVIIWGGKILSHGKFSLNGKSILIKEEMPDGKTRAFPFYVSELTGKEIVFDTTGEDGSKVTAVK
jgi:hypothetical protein